MTPGDRIFRVHGSWQNPSYRGGVVTRVLNATFTITLDGDTSEHPTKYVLAERAKGYYSVFGADYVVPATPEEIARQNARIGGLR